MSDKLLGAAPNNRSESLNCSMLQLLFFWFQKYVRKDLHVDVNEHEGLSNITLGYKLKKRNSAFIAVLHFIVTVV